MLALSIKDVATVIGGKIHKADPHTIITGEAEFDSRKIGPGGIFFALKGAQVDGHDFAQKAIELGATVVVAARELDADIPHIIVPPVENTETNALAFAHDPTGQLRAVVQALSLLAHHVLDVAAPQIIGITGSAGKTSTKDMLSTIMRTAVDSAGAHASIISPQGSFNNEIGLPYTATKVHVDTDYFIAEYSARSIGNIAALCEVATPDISIILNVGTAHLGEFGSQENIARAKGELVEATKNSGLIILNANDKNVADMWRRVKPGAHILFISLEGKEEYIPEELKEEKKSYSYVRAHSISMDEYARTHCTVDYDLHYSGTQKEKGSHVLTLQVSGEHNILNALAALSAALCTNMTEESIFAALAGYRPLSEHRMALSHYGDNIIIDDAFNANPSSMRAGLEAAHHIAQQKNMPLIAVLGVMGELGEDSYAAHKEIAQLCTDYGAETIIAVGDEAELEAYGVEPIKNIKEAACQLATYIGTEPVVIFIKASHSTHLWEIMDHLPKKN